MWQTSAWWPHEGWGRGVKIKNTEGTHAQNMQHSNFLCGTTLPSVSRVRRTVLHGLTLEFTPASWVDVLKARLIASGHYGKALVKSLQFVKKWFCRGEA